MSRPKLPKEAVQFAKSMGLSLDGLEPEAEDIWRMLDQMSSANPMQYEEFIAQQFANAKNQEEGVDDGRKSFRPTPGYCVETTTKGGDGLKIRELGGGRKLYINLTSSVVIEEPTDKDGKPIKGDRSVADGLSIPLIVGAVRDLSTSAAAQAGDEGCRVGLAVDVVVHPRVLEISSHEKYFKAQVVDLAKDWVQQETHIECEVKWDFVEEKYVGGRGEDRQTPVLFFVDKEGKPVGEGVGTRTGDEKKEPLSTS
ncbi:pre-RNA processing PIH1/Nop17-domain-containing protein, partial [Ochromonadaceae sp. CCMP2298]